MYDSPPGIDPVFNLARTQMEQIPHIHVVHLAIVSGKDETQVVQFDEAAYETMMTEDIPALIREIEALGVVVSSPAPTAGRFGAVVTLVDRTIEAFYVPIVRIVNAETLVGDFRLTTVVDRPLYEHLHAELEVNWIKHDRR